MGVIMDLKIFLPLLLLLLLSETRMCLAEKVIVTVQGVTTIAKTDDNFICATLDWWPPSKCNYGQCPWKMTSILNLDLKNPHLANAIKAFDSLRIRVGGSLQDQILYDVGDSVKKCYDFRNQTNGFLFGFSKGCLHMDRWDEINDFFGQSRVLVTFGLNALFGRKKVTEDGLWAGPWNPSNARDFIEYTISKGHEIDSWEFGNELCGGGVSARVEATQYGEDVIVLRGLLDELYRNSTSRPKLLGPGGFFDQQWFYQFLQTSGPGVVDGMTHHIYNLGAGVDPNLLQKVQDPYFLDRVAQTYRDVEVTVRSFPWTSAWIGESGGAFNSGGRNVSDSFADSFWYLDQLGMTSEYDHKVFCRQSLIGGNYGLLNTMTMVPNPDYYGALLWHRLMGKGVLSTTHNSSPYLRTYSHCSRNETGITLLLINLSAYTSFDVSVVNDMNLYPPRKLISSQSAQCGSEGQREEYHLTPKDGDIQSHTLLLNGSPLELTHSGDIPSLKPTLLDASSPIHIAPHSIAFITLKDFHAPACN